jgi:hypothetical protein
VKKNKPMSRVEVLLSELDTWDDADVQLLYQALVRRLLLRNQASASTLHRLQKYVGIGRGVWQEDAQQHVNRLREDRDPR